MKRRLQVAVSIPALTIGLGSFSMSSADEDLDRVSGIRDYFKKPTAWSDERFLVCEHQRGNSTCSVKFHLLSNQHFEGEAERLRSRNGALSGPTCGACGHAYIQTPEEFAFNGANARERAKYPGVWLIRKPLSRQEGCPISASVDHARQKDRSGNIRILSELLNKVATNGLRRVLAPAYGPSEAGMARIYVRIFSLERVVLAHERAQFA